MKLSDDLEVKIRMIDCVGFMAEGASGHIEKDEERQVKTPWFEYEIPFTKAQFETMFSAMHPKLVRLYWPLEGAARTLREDGVSGLTRKIGKHLRKGEHE